MAPLPNGSTIVLNSWGSSVWTQEPMGTFHADAATEALAGYHQCWYLPQQSEGSLQLAST